MSPLRIDRVGISLFGLTAVLCAVLAAASIWLILTDPVTVADAVNEGKVTPFVSELAGVLFHAIRGLLSYL
ncbi:MAG: hypothetical protein KGN76_05765 [Acidobacteriota bacterium]|nr:hypothetical protein [Acidobacteriota bacterium]